MHKIRNKSSLVLKGLSRCERMKRKGIGRMGAKVVGNAEKRSLQSKAIIQ
jgi:hypothetical protein